MPSSTILGTDSVWTPATSITRHRRIVPSISSALLSLFLGHLFFANFVTAISVIYCSPDNTGAADYQPFNFNWQSNGKCYERCVGKYAFGILLGKDCWCSNIIPDNQKDLDECADPCPGYPYEMCGNAKRKYFNYIELPDVIPTPKPEPSSTSVRSTTRRQGPATVSVPVTVTFIPSDSSTTAPPMETTDPPTTPIISVTTVLGTQMTITITPPSGASSSGFPVTSGGGGDFFSDAGRAAGVFVGLFLALAIIAGLIFFFIRKRRQNRRKSVGSSHHNPEMGMSGSGSPQLGTGSASPNNRPRSTSTLGLVGGLGSQDKSATVTTTGFTETDRVTDQRLDPNQIWMRFDNDNSSRVSLRSLQDNQDYSRRVLKLTNPDA